MRRFKSDAHTAIHESIAPSLNSDGAFLTESLNIPLRDQITVSKFSGNRSLWTFTPHRVGQGWVVCIKNEHGDYLSHHNGSITHKGHCQSHAIVLANMPQNGRRADQVCIQVAGGGPSARPGHYLGRGRGLAGLQPICQSHEMWRISK